MLLNLSAAFDTVDHQTLLRRMKISYGVNGTGSVPASPAALSMSAVPDPGRLHLCCVNVCGVPQGVGLQANALPVIYS